MNEPWEFGEQSQQPTESDESQGHRPDTPGGADTQDGSATSSTRDSFPWPPEEGSPILAAFGATWKNATFDPGAFFQRTPRDRGTGAAILYYLAIGILVAGTALFWESLSLVSDPMAGDALGSELGFQSVNPAVAFLLSPAFLLAGLFIAAGVIHVLLLMFGGADHGFGTTVRVYCYASSPTLFGVVPLLGTVIGGIWSLVLVIIGLREAHQAAAWKPVVAVLLPFVLLMGFLFLVFVVAIVAASGGLPAG